MTKLKLNIAGTELEYEGSEKFLEAKVLRFLTAFKKSHNAEIKKDLLALQEDLQQNLATLESYSANVSHLNGELVSSLKQFSEKSNRFLETVKTQAANQAELFQATKDMQEMQMSFNLQYLQLQSQMQNENRQFTMVSNIMKTKHDTVKNSISNIR